MISFFLPAMTIFKEEFEKIPENSSEQSKIIDI